MGQISIFLIKIFNYFQIIKIDDVILINAENPLFHSSLWSIGSPRHTILPSFGDGLILMNPNYSSLTFGSAFNA